MRIDLTNCLISTEPSLQIDVHRAALITEYSSQHPLSYSGVAEALYRVACKLGPLKRNPNASVTCGNMNE
jgi:hypothetical protein